ncbi:hypothetical protein EBB07_21110 [Paenibacillaceae bacterium]|nr:hypothetical protein EBB07_21110 [Paenibacillaceae bacterium]
MKTWIFHVKRDLRLLLPVNGIFFLLLVLGTLSLKLFQIRIGRTFETGDFEIIAFLLYFFFVLSLVSTGVEVFWYEWRKGTKFNWYLSPGSMYVKLLSKVSAVFLWQWFQIIALVFLFLLLTFWIGSSSIFDEILAREMKGMSEYTWEFIWGGGIIRFVSVIPILFGTVLFLGIKTWHKYAYMVVYIAIVFGVYPYVANQLSSTHAAGSAPLLIGMLDISFNSIILHLIVAIGVYALMHLFITRKLEL